MGSGNSQARTKVEDLTPKDTEQKANSLCCQKPVFHTPQDFQVLETSVEPDFDGSQLSLILNDIQDTKESSQNCQDKTDGMDMSANRWISK